MALDILVTTDHLSSDPTAREFIEHLQRDASRLGIDDGALYYRFPTYADYEAVTYKPDALLTSKRHGVLAIMFVNGLEMAPLSNGKLAAVDESLGQFSSILIGRLLKSRSLRRSLSTLRFPVTPVMFVMPTTTGAAQPIFENSEAVTSLGGFDHLLSTLKTSPVDEEVLDEIRSVIEGAKALVRPQRRIIEDVTRQRPAVALAKLEAEIANFDQQQRRAALVTVPGPQRIRGLAGSGKTVILAMKAAHLHLEHPDQRILVTFFTRSLRASLKTMVTRFFRHYKDEDPDWDMIQIRHGWGGSSVAGAYSDACRREGLVPLSFGAARQRSRGVDPFDFACRDLLSRAKVKPFYDHVLIDEGQDFPTGFYELCHAITHGDQDEKPIVWAYDELQNILDVKIRSPEELFGVDAHGQPRVSLERSGRNLPPGATNDTVLSKCYRNQREVLVTAHALGFGIYRNIVQLLESREHWQDVGYEVETEGAFSVGDKIRILRPERNSPLSIDDDAAPKIIEHFVTDSLAEEVAWAVGGIQGFITGGLQPEEILVIALDDRNARAYLRDVSTALAERGLESNNIIADPYNEPPFSIPGKVTLSTVYRAKGNEASVVFALGVDGIVTRSRLGRNKLFTAFTRTKAWLRVSGIGPLAKEVCQEIDAALKRFPYLEFVMPDLNKIELIQRDLNKRAASAKKKRDEIVRKLRKEGYSDEDIADILVAEAKDA